MRREAAFGKTVPGRGTASVKSPGAEDAAGAASRPRWLEQGIKKNGDSHPQRIQGHITRDLQVWVGWVLQILFCVSREVTRGFLRMVT